MTSSTLPSRIAPGACGALILGATIFGTTALAQTSPPSAPAAASQFPPTATITTPGYPGVGPADFKLRVVNLPNGKKMHLLPATLDGIVLTRPEPRAEEPPHLCLDAGYAAAAVRDVAAARAYDAHIRGRGDERTEQARNPGWRARRWVVERTHSWLNRSR